MNASTAVPDTAPWYAHRWPWLLMLGPAFVAVAGTATCVVAFKGQDALVVGDYYKQGKAINQDLRRDRAAAALGLSADFRYDAAEGMLRGHIGSSKPLRDETLSIRLQHATQPSRDMLLLARPGADGTFSVALPMLERSRWQVLVEGKQRDWRLEGSWQWPAERAVSIRAGADAPAG
ncbi:FixH family protein [Pseudoduganella violaceinigra]|uniref:FixH family protein n=1 Tax=Pseudoduganella violaceinigra TaxID=246602 RepID=UPI0004134C08|nr:FixH family protein [Pseudoduganella violaceinigra]